MAQAIIVSIMSAMQYALQIIGKAKHGLLSWTTIVIGYSS